MCHSSPPWPPGGGLSRLLAALRTRDAQLSRSGPMGGCSVVREARQTSLTLRRSTPRRARLLQDADSLPGQCGRPPLGAPGGSAALLDGRRTAALGERRAWGGEG
eukprot:scaffold24900_cov57-Phaeocystis_antarctica.AAC.1